MSDAADAAEEWLRGEVRVNGREQAAPETVTALLLKVFGDAWTVDDIIQQGDRPSAQLLDFWAVTVDYAADQESCEKPTASPTCSASRCG